MKAKIAGMRASTVAAVNFVALLHPSWPHVSQNSVLIYDGVDVLIQLSAGAFMSSQEQDLEITILSLTVGIKSKVFWVSVCNLGSFNGSEWL